MIAWRGLRVTGRHAPYRVRPYRGCSIMGFFPMLLSMPSMCACVCTVTQRYNAGPSIERPCIRLPFAAVATIGHFDLSVTPQFTQMCKLIPGYRQRWKCE